MHGIIRDGMPVALGPCSDAAVAEQFLNVDVAELCVLASAPSLTEAFTKVQPLMDATLDALSFQMQAALHVVSFETIDVTPPISVGDRREFELHTPPDTAVSPKFGEQPPSLNWREFPVAVPDLRDGPLPADAKQRMALWWYIKGLDTPYAVDKFMCLWTSLEILWSLSGVKVEAPYTPACGHVLGTCPICDRSVSKVVRGPSIKRLLVEQADVRPEDAAALWKLRQVVHGKDVFDVEQLELGGLTSELRAAVLRLLKITFRDALDQAPLLARVGGLTMGNRVFLTCSRDINDRDLAMVDLLCALDA